MPKMIRIPKWLLGYLICFTVHVYGQPSDLPMEAIFQQAYQEQTRSYTGAPGPNYFQNRSDYRIRVSFDPDTRLITGKETIVYQNNSPDSLDQLVIRLYQDRLREDFEGDYRLSEATTTGGVNIHSILLDEDSVQMTGDPSPVSRSGTNLFIDLASPLLPESRINIHINWSFLFPAGVANRYGTYAEHAYFVAYWYPQMAVYDDVFGWDVFDHTGQYEFYNDFGDFEVEINVPDSLVVWSTGTLLNPEEVLTPTYLTRYQKALVSDTVIKIISEEDYAGDSLITQPNGRNTWKYVASYIPDFAFAMSDFYYWDATSAQVEDNGRRVLTDACYNPKAEDFYEIAGYAKEIVEDLSYELPGIPYPYPKVTVFNGEFGGGGMEFPMIVNDGSSFSLGAAFSLTYHEIAHTYFPFYMGINERRFAWMDEGWASFFPVDLMGKKAFSKNPMSENVSGFVGFSRFGKLSPLMTPSIEIKGMSYYVASYYHPATAYYLLRDMLGDSVFTAALHTYMDRWHGKHPVPYDFFFTFDEVAGEPLDWYWKAWFFESGKPDLGLEVKKIRKRKAQFSVVRKGSMPVPVRLKINLEDGTDEEIYYTADVWKDGKETLDIRQKFSSNILSIGLGASDIPDANRKDNIYKVKKKKS